MGILDILGLPNPFDNIRSALGGQGAFPPAPAAPRQDFAGIVKELFPEVANDVDRWAGMRGPDEGIRPDRKVPAGAAEQGVRDAIAEQGGDPNGPLADSSAKLKAAESGVQRTPLPNVQPRRPAIGRDMASYRQAIKNIESSGGNYQIIGPTHPKLGRALGAYQVMEANVGPWSREALGREVSTAEFLKSPAIQDAIFDHKFGQFIARYGSPEDAASVWFTGRPRGTKGSDTATDSLGTSGANYVAMFQKHLGSASSAQPGGGSALPRPEAPELVYSPSDAVTGPGGREASVNRQTRQIAASYEPGAEEDALTPPDPNAQRRRLLADAIKQTRSTSALRGMPRAEIVGLLQEMGRSVALPRVGKTSKEA